jgi:LmbE family N-acetylglucosaminyl deacetylase
VSFEPEPGDRVVVVSPHLDDGVLSLGGAIARWVRRDADVLVLTVLGCDPNSAAPAGGWDRRAGFTSEAEAARARRLEDKAACDTLGAAVEWLPFGSSDYERHGDDTEVQVAVTTTCASADKVLLPGAPLSHPDHRWLTQLLLEGNLRCTQVGLYAEQPYRARSDVALGPPDWLASATGAATAFEGIRLGWHDRIAKLRAIRCYRSQLPLLGLGRRGGWPLGRLLLAEAGAGGEAVAWVERCR